MNRTVIYLRVSSDSQTEESQLELCEELCKKKEYEIVGVYKDHAKSAYKNVKRPSFDKVNELAKNREIDHVVVWALDRWTRRGPREFKNSVDYLSAYGVQLHSVREQWVENLNLPDSIGILIKDFCFGVMAWMSEADSQHTSECIKNSKKYKKAMERGLVGRNPLPEHVVSKVTKRLNEGKSYKQIHDEVTYKVKYGKVMHVSIGTISSINREIKNGLNL